MKIKKTLTEAQLAQRRANAEAQKAKGKKVFKTVRMDVDAYNLIHAYVADRSNRVDTISDAVRKAFAK